MEPGCWCRVPLEGVAARCLSQCALWSLGVLVVLQGGAHKYLCYLGFVLAYSWMIGPAHARSDHFHFSKNTARCLLSLHCPPVRLLQNKDACLQRQPDKFCAGKPGKGKLRISDAFNSAHAEGCECCQPSSSTLEPGFWRKVGFGEQAGQSWADSSVLSL